MSGQTNHCPTCEHHASEIERLRAEADRYREPLETIAEGYEENSRYCRFCGVFSGTHYDLCPYVIAHRALYPNPEGTP